MGNIGESLNFHNLFCCPRSSPRKPRLFGLEISWRRRLARFTIPPLTFRFALEESTTGRCVFPAMLLEHIESVSSFSCPASLSFLLFVRRRSSSFLFCQRLSSQTALLLVSRFQRLSIRAVPFLPVVACSGPRVLARCIFFAILCCCSSGRKPQVLPTPGPGRLPLLLKTACTRKMCGLIPFLPQARNNVPDGVYMYILSFSGSALPVVLPLPMLQTLLKPFFFSICSPLQVWGLVFTRCRETGAGGFSVDAFSRTVGLRHKPARGREKSTAPLIQTVGLHWLATVPWVRPHLFRRFLLPWC